MEAGFLDHLFAAPAMEAGVVELRPAPARRVAEGLSAEPSIEELDASGPAWSDASPAEPAGAAAARVETVLEAAPAPVHEPSSVGNTVPESRAAARAEHLDASEPVRADRRESEHQGREGPAMQGPPLLPTVPPDAVSSPEPKPAPGAQQKPGPAITQPPLREVVVERETRVEEAASAQQRVDAVPAPAAPALPAPTAMQPAAYDAQPKAQRSQPPVAGSPPQTTIVLAEAATSPAGAPLVVESKPAPRGGAPARVAEPAAGSSVPVVPAAVVAQPVERRAVAEAKPQPIAPPAPQTVTVRIGRVEIVARAPKPLPAARRAVRAARSHQIDPHLPLGRGGR